MTAPQSTWGDNETQFFYQLTPDKILDAVEATGVRCTGRCIALNSLENRVYEVELDNGTPRGELLIAKFYRPGRWSKEQILEEHAFLLRCVECELPVVAPQRFADGSTLREMDGIGIFYAFFPRVRGQSLALDEIPPADLLQLGRLLARIHNVGAVTDAPHRLHLTPENYGDANLDWLLDNNVITDDVRDAYQDAAEEFIDATYPLFDNISTQLVHGDFHLGNVLWGSEGPMIVDFDDCVVGPPVQDIWLLAGGRDKEAQKRLALILDGYEQMREFDRSTLVLIEALRGLRLIHFNAWIAKRWGDPSFPRAFPHYGTSRYWQDAMLDLREQTLLLTEGWRSDPEEEDG